jgi:cytochrome c
MMRCVLVMSLVLALAPAMAASPSSSEMDDLASAKGCYLCHRAVPAPRKADGVLPYAPSWQDIARRYKGDDGAQQRLTDIVLAGSWNDARQRHWVGKVSEVGMLPNVKEIDEDQARHLVHWILSSPR